MPVINVEDLKTENASSEELQIVTFNSDGKVTAVTLDAVDGVEVINGHQFLILKDSVTNENGENEEAFSIEKYLTFPEQPKPLPPGTPAWAAKLRDCEKVGTSYRGWVRTEAELDIVLTMHKQTTMSVWGTRQSSCPGKNATRLMWKSQYVPFDGIPFVNTGSRAVVQECQHGPRRRGAVRRSGTDSKTKNEDFKATCPARIYIKKVKKFPTFRVNICDDRKALKEEMDKSFRELKQALQDNRVSGEERHYVHLPAEEAHEFHSLNNSSKSIRSTFSDISANDQSEMDLLNRENTDMGDADSETDTIIKPLKGRLHPLIRKKIREYVASGQTQLYEIRSRLRIYAERNLKLLSASPRVEKHDLSIFPTVHDLQNQIQMAIEDAEKGSLKLADNVTVEALRNSKSLSHQKLSKHSKQKPRTFYVTFSKNEEKPLADESHSITKVEMRYPTGTTKSVSKEELAQIMFKSLPKEIFVANVSNDLSVEGNSLESDDHLQTNTLMTELPDHSLEFDNSQENPLLYPVTKHEDSKTDSSLEFVDLENKI
ncbi:DgyrCDS6193 [Dimorphilus gyrociliatus]|uniref:DgyrCDS6193 n=1 Tax=Dimorphilus gyrociliatus TaxID=2664684 RepID=A0A7I8VMC1_9ANNE|nr:DgyrCDS6193 [Dimorphilus gyrociliatus]